MNEEQKERFISFIIDLESSIKEFKEYLNEREEIKSIVFKSFLDGLDIIISNLKKDIEFLNKEELFFDVENTEKAYITNFIIERQTDINSMIEFISNKEDVDFKTFSVFLNDFLSKIRNLRQNVKFLQGDFEYTIKAIKIEDNKS